MNVLWITSDQLRWDYLSCNGATHIGTPNLDRLAAKGVRFDRACLRSHGMDGDNPWYESEASQKYRKASGLVGVTAPACQG